VVAENFVDRDSVAIPVIVTLRLGRPGESELR
jgi:hypothetical protein